jgi:iron(III) transport system substrate-binding protein
MRFAVSGRPGFRLGGLAAVVLVSLVGGSGCRPSREVVVYTSVDDVFARPIAARFERETGIAVRLVPDTEETKSAGLLNRLVAEKARPRADVFWSGDPVRAAILKAMGVSAPYRSGEGRDLPQALSDGEGHWTGFSARARVLLYNTSVVPPEQRPSSILDLVNPRFQRRACLANPLFGTTSMHVAALVSAWGGERTKAFLEDFTRNGGRLAASNGDVKRRVASGECALGLTDTDDAFAAVKDGASVATVYPDAEGLGTLVVPNAVVLIAGAPHAEPARRFIDFLLSPAVERALAESDAAQMPVRPGVAVPPGVLPLGDLKAMPVDYARLGGILHEIQAGWLKDWVDRNLR